MIRISRKIKLKDGPDSTQMMTHKLVSNFMRVGKMEVTVKRARLIKAQIDLLVSYAKKNTNRPHLLSRLHDDKLVKRMYEVIVPSLKDHSMGYVTLKKLGPRVGDGAQLARVAWITPMIEKTVAAKEDKKEASSKEIMPVKEAKTEPKKVKTVKSKK